MRTMHLFAGIGGGLYADAILGHEPVVAVEQDAYCCKVLRQQFPGVQVWGGDIKLFDPSTYKGRVDCIAAGFPCQDISTAGKGEGLDGEKSSLFFEVVRIVCAIRPRFVFLENVPAINLRGLDQVLGALADLRYDACWAVLSAAEIGAPHLRKRWWCLATDSNSTRCQSLVSVPKGQDKEVVTVGGSEDVSDAHRKRRNKRSGGETRRGPEFTHESRWPTEPDVGRVGNGLSAQRHRIKGLGNAQVPLQAAYAFKILLDFSSSV